MAILITAASFSLAYKLERLLNESEVYFADQIKMPAIPGKKFIQLPDASSAIFISELLKLCLENNIMSIYPLKKSEIKELLNADQLFKEYNINIIFSKEWPGSTKKLEKEKELREIRPRGKSKIQRNFLLIKLI